jgi:hypothetical protein
MLKIMSHSPVFSLPAILLPSSSRPIRPHIRTHTFDPIFDPYSTPPIHTTVIDERDMLPIIHYRVDVNFSLELRSLIREARYLERLGTGGRAHRDVVT